MRGGGYGFYLADAFRALGLASVVNDNAGALAIGLVNDAASPLAAACDIVLPIGAGAEFSVAATKTFVATLSAILRLTAAWSDNPALTRALDNLPERLERASALDWSASFGAFAGAASMMTIGRGPTLAIAGEET